MGTALTRRHDTETVIKKAKLGNADSWIRMASSWIDGRRGRSLMPLGRFVARVDSSVTTTTIAPPMSETPRYFSAKICISRTMSASAWTEKQNKIMNQKPTPSEGQSSEQTRDESASDGATCYALSDTRIMREGVIRCCLSSVTHEYDHMVKIGARSRCEHCGEWFTLALPLPGYKYPKWTPDRFIQHNAERTRGSNNLQP